MISALQRIGSVGIVPVIRAAGVDEAMFAVDAIYAAGIPVVELTMTIPNAPAAISKVLALYGERIVVGAGTVLNADDALRCLDAGAHFLVSPGLSIPVLNTARNAGALAIPGILTPTELMHALSEGASVVKVFPCSSAGGPQHLKALHGPFPDIALIPTGGVNPANATDYIRAGAFALGVGGNLGSASKHGGYSSITDMAKKLMAAVQTARNTSQI